MFKVDLLFKYITFWENQFSDKLNVWDDQTLLIFKLSNIVLTAIIQRERERERNVFI